MNSTPAASKACFIFSSFGAVDCRDANLRRLGEGLCGPPKEGASGADLCAGEHNTVYQGRWGIR
jgi:hypothetical protein